MNVDYYIDDPCIGVNGQLRDNVMVNPIFWKQLDMQHNSNAVTDMVMLFGYIVLQMNTSKSLPSILTNGNSKIRLIATPLGAQVANILINTPLVDCKIVEYSINVNKVGKEISNNRVSLVMYGHWDTPCTINDAQQKMLKEVTALLFDPIQQLLNANNAAIIPGAYNHFSEIYNRMELEELLMLGPGVRFTKGYFYE